tara:strand:- start:1644 stop:1931 length:288 start_codon:yes stop_codon:yes gene_type:complete
MSKFTISDRINKKTLNDLDKLLKTLSIRLNKEEYTKSVKTIWALLNGAQFGLVETWSSEFLREAEDIYIDTQNEKKKSSLETRKYLMVIKGGKNA